MIRIVEDLGAPALVTGVDIVTLETGALDWNEYAAYIMTGVGYLSAFLPIRMGGVAPFLKNMGIASLPLTARHIYERVKASQTTSRRAGAGVSRLALNPITRSGGSVTRQYQTEFEGAGAHAY